MKTFAFRIAPTSEWAGNDGLWSTFLVQLGNPIQKISVLPSTSGSAIWAINPLGCLNQPFSGYDCESIRGQVFDPSGSETFSWLDNKVNRSLVALDYAPEASLWGDIP